MSKLLLEYVKMIVGDSKPLFRKKGLLACLPWFRILKETYLSDWITCWTAGFHCRLSSSVGVNKVNSLHAERWFSRTKQPKKKPYLEFS
mmetsp:Transcript_16234/g.21334  ORF Transcript_16234/g.21334 Transcript_16234/m.21334 type:complete len:89 (+) Transcript_16234:1287-1553(+)